MWLLSGGHGNRLSLEVQQTKVGGKGLRKSGRGNKRWEERGVLLFGQDGVCVHVCMCARNQACYNS